MKKKDISAYFSGIAKLSHKKSPRSKAFYRRIQKLSTIARMRKGVIHRG
jgi:hypothetical protein